MLFCFDLNKKGEIDLHYRIGRHESSTPVEHAFKMIQCMMAKAILDQFSAGKRLSRTGSVQR